MAYNSVDDDVAEFFSSTSATREECDSIARTAFEGPVWPVAVQGATSYTVVAGRSGDKIVQFRDRNAQLDIRMLELAKRVHADLVLDCTALGWIGNSTGPQLAVYAMDKLPGDNYALVRAALADDLELQLASVRSLARFFAQAWLESVPPDQVDITAMATELRSRLYSLSSSGILTSALVPMLTKVITHLPALTSATFPLTITHSNLNELNILVDPSSGRITGVIDWTHVGVQPFGLTLYALDIFIGYMGPHGWVYLDNAHVLEKEFWTSFADITGQISASDLESIRIARIAGCFLRYGTMYSSEQKGVAGI
ncbi:hypothetical protein RB600_008908 [Gaeumannomyces tritici]